jgi:hypothetical protein
MEPVNSVNAQRQVRQQQIANLQSGTSRPNIQRSAARFELEHSGVYETNRESLGDWSDLDEQRQEATTAGRRQMLEEIRTLLQALQLGETDPERLVDLIFYARHPEMLDQPLLAEHAELIDEWNNISARLVHPVLAEVASVLPADPGGPGFSEYWTPVPESAGQRFRNTATFNEASGHFDGIISRATEWCPGLSPSVLKALLVQESGLDPTVINGFGYAGIAQIGRDEAREVGLYVGLAGSRSDERLNPHKAIPAAARLLDIKAQRLGEAVFSRYGQPAGIEYWKFVLAAYNGGEGTIALAMGNAHRRGLALARARGLIANEAVGFARAYASRWSNLIAGGPQSPLAVAATRYFPSIAFRKYVEISGYPEAILGRCLGTVFRTW